MSFITQPRGQYNYFFGNALGSGFAPTDNVNHYLINASNPTNTAPTAANSSSGILARRAGIITDIYLMLIVAGTNGSGETGGTVSIRVNDTTDTQVLSGLLWNVGSAGASHSANNLTVAIAANDFWAVKIDPPTWATNPTGVFYVCQLVMVFTP